MKNDTVTKLAMDVGCHRGDSSRKLLERGWMVIGIDANPRVTGSIGYNENLRVITSAVSSQAGFVDFFVNDAKEDWSSLEQSLAARGGHGVRRITACAITLEMLVEHFGLPDYLKLDIEGGELDALAGLGCHRPTVISFEVDHLGMAEDGLLSLALSLGYGWFAWAPQSSNEIAFPSALWQSIDELSKIPSGWCDLFLSNDPNWRFVE